MIHSTTPTIEGQTILTYHGVVTGEAIVHEGALSAGAHQPGVPEGLQVHGRRGQGEVGGAGEGLDGVLALGEQVEQLEALGVREALAGAGELLVQGGLGVAAAHWVPPGPGVAAGSGWWSVSYMRTATTRPDAAVRAATAAIAARTP